MSDNMGNPKRCAPSSLAILSVSASCSSASQFISELKSTLRIDPTAEVCAGLLREEIFFHHFIALHFIRYAVNPNYLRSYTDGFLDSIRNGDYRPYIEDLNYLPVEVQDKAVQLHIFGFGSIGAVMSQDLYLKREPSDQERRIIEDPFLRGQANSTTDAIDHVNYFSLALMARYCNVLKIERQTQEYILLYFKVAAEVMAAADLYKDALGLTDGAATNKGRPKAPGQTKTGWLSRLFK